MREKKARKTNGTHDTDENYADGAGRPDNALALAANAGRRRRRRRPHMSLGGARARARTTRAAAVTRGRRDFARANARTDAGTGQVCGGGDGGNHVNGRIRRSNTTHWLRRLGCGASGPQRRSGLRRRARNGPPHTAPRNHAATPSQLMAGRRRRRRRRARVSYLYILMYYFCCFILPFCFSWFGASVAILLPRRKT